MMNQNREKILEFLLDGKGGERTSRDIVEHVAGKSLLGLFLAGGVYPLLREMEREGALETRSEGRYPWGRIYYWRKDGQ